jgi:hypothetical protein
MLTIISHGEWQKHLQNASDRVSFALLWLCGVLIYVLRHSAGRFAKTNWWFAWTLLLYLISILLRDAQPIPESATECMLDEFIQKRPD